MNEKLLYEKEDTLYKAERTHVFQYPGIRQIFLLACIFADAFTLYSVFDLLLSQRADLTWVITGTVAACLNVSPMLLASCIRNKELGRKMKTVLASVLLSVFVILFVATFGLRLTSRSQLFVSTSNLTISGFEIEEPAEPEEDEMDLAKVILAFIISMEPLCTSALTFYLGYEVSPERKKEHLKRKMHIAMQEQMDKYQVMIRELSEDMKFDLKAYDDSLYENMKELLQRQGEELKILSRRLLTEAAGSPEAVSYLMEEGYKARDSDKIHAIEQERAA